MDQYNNGPEEPEEELEDAIIGPDLSNIESKDPSLVDGFNIIYNKEVPLDIKLETEEGPKDIASFESINVKVLSDAVNEKADPTRVKVELSWESDLLFHYTSIVDEETFVEMKKKQNLNIGFKEYTNLIEKICENCINLPDVYIGTFTIQKDDGVSQLQFVKSSDFKNLELLMLEFKKSSDEIIQKDMLYRFTYLKSKLEYDKKVIKIAGEVIRDCNPDIFDPILESNNNYNIDVNKFFGDKHEQ
jgi:hypothetical protein